MVALGLLAYFGYPLIKERYFESEEITENEFPDPDLVAPNEMEADLENHSDVDFSEDESEPENSFSPESEEIRDATDESGDSSNVTAEDCDNECSNFKNNASDLRYCQDLCGLSSASSNDNCDSLQGSDKDYCFKNQAIAKTDLRICDSIADAKIKSACKNRVTEDLLEQQP